MLGSTFDQFSGLNFTWNPDEEVGWRVVDVWVEESAGSWKLLDSSTVYTISCMDYISKGGDGHTVYPLYATDVIDTGVSSDTVIHSLLPNITFVVLCIILTFLEMHNRSFLLSLLITLLFMEPQMGASKLLLEHAVLVSPRTTASAQTTDIAWGVSANAL